MRRVAQHAHHTGRAQHLTTQHMPSRPLKAIPAHQDTGTSLPSSAGQTTARSVPERRNETPGKKEIIRDDTYEVQKHWKSLPEIYFTTLCSSKIDFSTYVARHVPKLFGTCRATYVVKSILLPDFTTNVNLFYYIRIGVVK